MGRGGAGRAGIDPPGEDRALPGPSRELVLALHELYRGAGKPSSREIALDVEKGHYRDTVSHDTIAKMLGGHSFPRWDKWDAVVRALAVRNAERCDPDAEARRVQELWLAAQDHANVNETPEDIIQAPDMSSCAGQIPRGAGKARSGIAADASGLIKEETAGCPMTDLETGGGRTLAPVQQADLFGEDQDAEMTRLLTTVRQFPGHDPSRQDAIGRAGPAFSGASRTSASHDLAPERGVAGADGEQGVRGGRSNRRIITIVSGLVVAIIGGLFAASLATSPSGPPYWSGGVTFASINFDATPPQSNFTPSRDWTLAINDRQDTLYAVNGARQAVWPGPGNPSFRQCRDLTSANPGPAGIKIWQGLRICVASASGRIAFLSVIHIYRYKGYDNEITGNAITWP